MAEFRYEKDVDIMVVEKGVIVAVFAYLDGKKNVLSSTVPLQDPVAV